MHEEQPTPTNDAALDALLAAARWRESDAAQLARLNAAWERSLAETAVEPVRAPSAADNFQGRRRFAQWSFVAAGAMLLCAVGAWAMLRERETKPEIVSPSPSPAPSVEPQPIHASTPIASRSPAPIVVRPPNQIETLLVRAWQSQAALEQFKTDALVESAIDAVREQRWKDARQFKRRMTARRAYYEQRLLDNARYFDGPRRAAALALLGDIGTSRVVPDVVALVEYDRSARDVAACVLNIVDAPRVAYLARSSRDAARRQAWLRVLVVSNQNAAHEAFLGCVLQPALRGDCLQVAQLAPVLPEDFLFAQLRSADAARRLAAAVVLAQSSNPRTVDRMIAAVRSGTAPDAAVVALVGNAQPQARSFVDQLRAAPRLVASVNAATNQWRWFVTQPDAAL